MTTYEVKFPSGFDLADLVQPTQVPSGQSCGYRWYFAAYGKLRVGDPARQYVFRWGTGDPVAERIVMEHDTTARGSLAVGAGGLGLWLMAHDAGKKVVLQQVPGWEPPDWMRPSKDYEAEIAALRRELEARPTGGGMDAGDREALNRLRDMIGI